MRPARMLVIAGVLLCLANNSHAQRQILHSDMTHLRSGEGREWSDFPEQSAGSRLQVEFSGQANSGPQTIGLRRIDVKEGWQVLLNGQLLGRLFSDENDMDEVWELAPGALRDGTNELIVEATGERIDDIHIGEIWIDPRPRAEVFGEATLDLSARDQTGELIPCRFTILNERGSLSAVGAESSDRLAVRSGVVYSSTGECRVGLAAGTYTVLCGRGFEYDLSQLELEIKSGESREHAFISQRVVDTPGLVACDTHVHTFEVSRHGDATLDERMITLVGEGIELAIATDHNVFIDYRPYLERLGLSRHVTPMIGNEVTTKFGHFNVFPAAVGAAPPNHQADTWDELADSIFSTPDLRVAILNHPRDAHSSFTPFGPENMLAAVGHRLDGRTLRANAMELINSAALQSDPMVVFHDWLTQVNRGVRLTAIGSSDSHEVSRKIVGQGRSYVYVDDADPGAIDIDAATDSLAEGRVLVSLGLLTELTIDGRARSGETFAGEGQTLDVAIKVQGPQWVQAERVELFANGQRIREFSIATAQRNAAGTKAEVHWTIDKPAHDVHLVALATGPGVVGLHWPIAKAYQPTTPEWVPYVFGSSGIVRIDADGDGRWTSALEYAETIVQEAGEDLGRLLALLEQYDLPTATFAAHLWSAAGRSIEDAEARAALQTAPEFIRAGMRDYARSLRESLQAR